MKTTTMKPIQEISYDRTRFGDIVSEFWVPVRPSQHAIILCDGCPSVPSKRTLGEFLAKKGYWVFHIRFRGTWESLGEFLQYPPHEDVLHVATRLNLGFQAMFSDQTYHLDINSVSVIGASFGGAVALVAAASPVISKVIAVSPATDFQLLERISSEKLEDLSFMLKFGFPGAYRGSSKNIRRLLTGKFLSPISLAREIDPEKVFVIQALDDTICPPLGVRKFSRLARIKPLYLESGGHLSGSIIRRREVWKQVRVFLGN